MTRVPIGLAREPPWVDGQLASNFTRPALSGLILTLAFRDRALAR